MAHKKKMTPKQQAQYDKVLKGAKDTIKKGSSPKKKRVSARAKGGKY